MRGFEFPETKTCDVCGIAAVFETCNGFFCSIECEHKEKNSDMVNHPPHYTNGEIECIDAIQAALGNEGFAAYCRGQIIKYTWRAGLKSNTKEDIQKAEWYAHKLAEVME